MSKVDKGADKHAHVVWINTCIGMFVAKDIRRYVRREVERLYPNSGQCIDTKRSGTSTQNDETVDDNSCITMEKHHPWLSCRHTPVSKASLFVCSLSYVTFQAAPGL
eukprot:Lithocolla_globosa_v1_NODE_1090_length_2879_cov_37.449912.p4 type:complete len:107 gc:universal NODE_1090_length_2879_cov_37.449912:2432-2112(-)